MLYQLNTPTLPVFPARILHVAEAIERAPDLPAVHDIGFNMFDFAAPFEDGILCCFGGWIAKLYTCDGARRPIALSADEVIAFVHDHNMETFVADVFGISKRTAAQLMFAGEDQVRVPRAAAVMVLRTLAATGTCDWDMALQAYPKIALDEIPLLRWHDEARRADADHRQREIAHADGAADEELAFEPLDLRAAFALPAPIHTTLAPLGAVLATAAAHNDVTHAGASA